MSQENADMVRRGYEAFNRRDFDAATSDLHDEVRWTPLFSVDAAVLEGKDEIRASWLQAVESLDIRIEIDELIPLGEERVVAIARWSGRGSASGTPVGQTAAQVFTLREGKAILVESYPSKQEALEAVGLSD